MYKIEEELFGQHVSLRQTCAFLQGSAEQIKDFIALSGFYSVTYCGCGIMGELARSAELSLKVRGGLTTMSFTGGDLMLNMPRYRDMLNGTLMFVSSRSGATSEVLGAVQKARDEAGALVIASSAVAKSKLSATADLCLEMPWIFDESTCATRSTTNFFLVNLFNLGLLAGDNALLDDLKTASDDQEGFIDEYSKVLETLAGNDEWEDVLLLADGEFGGVAAAGAQMLTRMGIRADHCPMLDVRHGRLGTLNEKTLVIAITSPDDELYQGILLHELRNKAAQVAVITSKKDNHFGADVNIILPDYKSSAAAGIPILFAMQALAFYRTVHEGRNPDDISLPAWVRL